MLERDDRRRVEQGYNRGGERVNQYEKLLEAMPCNENVVLKFTGAARRQKASRWKSGLRKVLWEEEDDRELLESYSM
jgi:hypothetical protein